MPTRIEGCGRHFCLNASDKPANPTNVPDRGARIASALLIRRAGVMHPLPTDCDREKVFVRGQSVHNSGGANLSTKIFREIKNN